MKKELIIIVIIALLVNACKSELEINNKEIWKAEIVQAEREFAEMTATEGIPAAFMAFSAEDVVILRNDSILAGKDALGRYYHQRDTGSEKVNLTWKPDYVDVAASGDLGYTYGRYKYEITDSLGGVKILEGIFHTVWKRQADGTWRFVWD